MPITTPTHIYLWVLTGVDMLMLWVDLGLSEEVKKISTEQQVNIYNEFMGQLEQDCVAELTELFLERSDLFDKGPAASAFDHVHQELKVSVVIGELITGSL